MKPTLFGYGSWYVLWTFAAVVGTVVNYAALRRQGVTRSSALFLLLMTAAAAVAGAKLFYELENGLPVSDLAQNTGYRMPGGFIAMAVVFPVLCRLLRVPVLRTLDAIAPGLALVIAIGRIGCFLTGCCFGTPTDLPWGVIYPSGSPAYVSQQFDDVLPADAPWSLPVHPLSLYFSVDSLVILAVLLWLTPRARYAGQIALCFIVLRTWSKAGLELLRGHDITSVPTRAGQVEFFIAVAASVMLLVVTAVRAARRPQYAIEGQRPGCNPARSIPPPDVSSERGWGA